MMARQKGVLDHVHAILTELGGAIDVALLTEKLYERGCIDGQSQKHRHRTYTRLFMDISNKGEDSRFRKCGKGMFCLSQHLSPDGPTPLARGDQRCGNCNYLEFTGIQVHQQLGGYCTNNGQSDRHYVKCVDDPCDYWKRRDTHKVARDSQQRADTQQQIQILNASVRARRR